MKMRLPALLIVLVSTLALSSYATVRFVDLASTNPTPPYLDWSTAAISIQDAIDVSVDGDQVLVASGVYQTGGKVMAGDLTNRVTLDKAVTVQSVNGPWATTVLGAGATNGTAAVRCAWLTNGASLVGFTLQAGATRMAGDSITLRSGGAVWCASSNALVMNCLILSNTAPNQGGGAYQGTIRNSVLLGNICLAQGGGAYGANLLNCTVLTNNFAGAYSCRLTNCIVYYNTGGDTISSSMSYCCASSIIPGTGSFNSSPRLFADGMHLNVGSPCIGTGTNFTAGTDLFGMPWANPPSVGCAEWQAGALVSAPRLQITGSPMGFTVGNVTVGGVPPFSYGWLKDGAPLQDDGHFNFTQTTNLSVVGVLASDAGNYQLVVSNASGVVTSGVAQLTFHYVNGGSLSPVAPYATWATAATNIQDAIGAALANEVVWVTNGLYATGGKSMDGVITNRISLDKALLVQSVNGPSVTTVQGALDPVSTNGPAAVRCAWLTNKAVLSGFTLYAGATRPSGLNQSRGGGVLGASTSAIVDHCLVLSNYSSGGGGAYLVTLNDCSLVGNHALNAGNGGGAANCNLLNCVLTANAAEQGSGGGCSSCDLTNCSLTGNLCDSYGGAANGGKLINCTITGNSFSFSGSEGGGVYGAALTNCIVWGNQVGSSHSFANYASGTLAYCCTDPLPSGPGNIDVDPQLLGDGVHLAQTSPCRGAGNKRVVVGTDIDGQPWNNPPSIGCDEWQPAPVIVVQPGWVLSTPPLGRFTVNVASAGQAPFTCYWSKDGVPLQDDAHHSNSSTTSLIVNQFGPADGGVYQVVVSNAFGVVTSQVAQVVIHAVDAANVNPVSPYSSWATAAATIQDAINISAPGDLVLVTDGVYATGGKVMAGDLTNRVALDKALTVMSVHGAAATVIQGAWDSATTNGPGAVRCAWLTNGAVLSGFTLHHGATRAGGYPAAPAWTGGGVWCSSANAVVSNCVLTNNSAAYGGGIANGTLNNSLVIGNLVNSGTGEGGGAYYTALKNCTVANNLARTPSFYPAPGAGTYNCVVQNSIVVGNIDLAPDGIRFAFDNFAYDSGYSGARYAYSCTSPTPLGTGNTADIGGDPAFLDAFHISCDSPCRGAGSALYSSGTDLDGEAWANPPSMGCDEPVLADRVGPLSVYLMMAQTNALANRMFPLLFNGFITGQAAWVQWSFGDGVTLTNVGRSTFHQWTNPGDYTVTFTAFNADNPEGVSSNLLVHVTLPHPVQLQTPTVLSNGFGFQFAGEFSANYTVQYATNLVPPVAWQTLTSFQYSDDRVYQITDPAGTNGTRFYRVVAQ